MERSKIQQVYGAGASRYEQVMQLYWEFDRAAVIKTLGLSPGRRVLEIGVGTGKNLSHYPDGVQITGIDFTPAMLAEARRHAEVLNGRQIELIEMDAQEMSFDHDRFDAALETFVLCVAPDPGAVLRETVRVTRPGAKIGVFDYCRSNSPDMVKWQELIASAATTMGFPPDVIVWDPLRDYAQLIHDEDLPLDVLEEERYESENPFLICCRMLLRNAK